jgi:hypothetical protein
MDDRGAQLAVGNRLVQEQQAAGLGLGQAIWRGIAGDKHRRDSFVVLRTQPLDDSNSVLAVAKPVIADNQIGPLLTARKLPDRFVARADDDGFVTPTCQQSIHGIANGELVVDHDNEAMREGTRCRVERILARRDAAGRHRNRDFEAGAAAYLRTKCHFAGQQIDKTANDGQS